MMNRFVFGARHQTQHTISMLEPPSIDVMMNKRAYSTPLVAWIDAEALQPPLAISQPRDFRACDGVAFVFRDRKEPLRIVEPVIDHISDVVMTVPDRPAKFLDLCDVALQ